MYEAAEKGEVRSISLIRLEALVFALHKMAERMKGGSKPPPNLIFFFENKPFLPLWNGTKDRAP